MRIGIVINTSWNIYNFRKGLIDHFQESGHDVIAIAPLDDYSLVLEKWGCKYEPVHIYSKSSNPFYDLFLVASLYRIYKKNKIDVVLHFTIKPNIYGSLAAALAGIPSIANVTGLGTVFIRDTKRSKVAKMLYYLAFRFPKVVFFQNNDDRALFIAKKLIKKSLTDVLPGSGIDLDYFQPTYSKPVSGQFTFLMVARLLYDKGIIEYVEAARLLRQRGVKATFQVLGAMEPVKGLGVSAEEVQTWVEDGIIEYLGKVNDVRQHVSNADCIVLPSYREGTPRSLIEACAMGKPIVTTWVPGCKETVIEGYNGRFCEPMNTIDLAEKMMAMYQSSAKELTQMGNNSRQLAVEKFDHEKIIQKYIAAITYVDNLCQRKTSASIVATTLKQV